jgi:hypothetical protein
MNSNKILELSQLASLFGSIPVTHLQYFVAQTVFRLYIHAVGYIDSFNNKQMLRDRKCLLSSLGSKILYTLYAYRSQYKLTEHQVQSSQDRPRVLSLLWNRHFSRWYQVGADSPLLPGFGQDVGYTMWHLHLLNFLILFSLRLHGCSFPWDVLNVFVLLSSWHLCYSCCSHVNKAENSRWRVFTVPLLSVTNNYIECTAVITTLLVNTKITDTYDGMCK